jgi:GNAT superfamily N-acetyltransferase
MNALPDGARTAYFHYLLVHPEHQSRGIGRGLIARMVANYRGYTRLVLVAYKEDVGFYEHCGFRVAERALSLQITSLGD